MEHSKIQEPYSRATNKHPPAYGIQKVAMELELRRHDWASLRAVDGDASGLGTAIQDLAVATSHEEALHAFRRVEKIVFANELLCEASPALASGLVHCLWRCSIHSEGLILSLLSDISAGIVCEEDPEIYGPVSYDECVREVSRGYPAYVEILKNTKDVNSRIACVDLILMCGLSSDDLRERSIYFLQNALDLDGLESHRSVIRASIDELKKSRTARS